MNPSATTGPAAPAASLSKAAKAAKAGEARGDGRIRYAISNLSEEPGSGEPLGKALVAQSARGVCAILLGDEEGSLEAELARYFPDAKLEQGGEGLDEVLADLCAFLRAPSRGFEHALDLGGTPFQQSVWAILRDIPVGSTVSYTDVAARVGRPEAVRAVASACGANRLAVVVPCHRVVGRSGSLTGYRWGLQRKRRLLEMEARG